MSALSDIAKRMAPVFNQATTHQPATRATRLLAEQFGYPDSKVSELKSYLRNKGSRWGTVSEITSGLDPSAKLPVSTVIDSIASKAPKYTVQRAALAKPSELSDMEEAYQALTMAGGAPNEVYDAVAEGIGRKAMPYSQYQRLGDKASDGYFASTVTKGDVGDPDLLTGQNLGAFRGSLEELPEGVALKLEELQAGPQFKDLRENPGVYQDILNAMLLQAKQNPEITSIHFPSASLINAHPDRKGADLSKVYDGEINKWLNQLGVQGDKQGDWMNVDIRDIDPRLVETRAQGGLMQVRKAKR